MASKRFSVRHRAPALRAVSVLLVLFVSCALLMLWGCGSGGSHAIKVSLASSASGSTVDAGSAAVTITATVANDSKNGGVTFSLSPATGCGSIPASSTGMSVVYTPQPTATLNADCTATITATSVSSTSSTSTLNFTVKAITVSFVNPPSTTTLTAGASPISLTAAFAHDTATDTVKWSISSGCGELEPNGTAAVYTPPSASLAAQCKATIAAASSVNPNLAASQTASIVFTVNPVGTSALVINTTSLPGGVVNVAYSAALQASGGTTPYTWSVAPNSSLPSWLNLSSSGTLSGTPTAAGTSNFTVKVTDASTPNPQSKTQALSVTVTAPSTACVPGTPLGNEKALSGQYAFSLSGFTNSGSMAAIGSFTADGSGHITGGSVDLNALTGIKSGSITPSGSSYSVGSDNRGCATIVTPAKTYNTRFALESTLSGASPEGALEEWESGATAYIATGQILKQTVPTALTNGNWVFQQIGITSVEQVRVGVAGTMTLNNGNITAGEYDSYVNGGTHLPCSGMTGTYTSPDSNGRFTDSTTCDNVTAQRVFYAVSSSQYFELTTAPLTTFAALIGKAQLQSGSLTLSGNLVFYGTGQETSGSEGTVQIGLVNIAGSNTLTATSYKNDAGVWDNPDPSTSTCTYAIDSYGKVSLSGTSCGNNPPVIYLTGPNTGVLLGSDAGVTLGLVQPQTATSINAGTYYFGMLEIEAVNYTAYLATEVGVATISSAGVVSGSSDETSIASPQQGNQSISDTLTVNSDGTITDSKHPGQVLGIVVSGSQFVLVDNQGTIWPTLLVIKTIPQS